MGKLEIRSYNKDEIDETAQIIKEAWDYYVQEIDSGRLKEMLNYYLTDETKKIFLAREEGKLVGVCELTILESYRYEGEEARMELLYIRDSAENYYDVHEALMDAAFNFLRDEQIEFLRVDTSLENADVLIV